LGKKKGFILWGGSNSPLHLLKRRMAEEREPYGLKRRKKTAKEENVATTLPIDVKNNKTLSL